eukprot:jgi/Orpsp1_1/1181128/evm.model.c7180000075980.1
MIIFIGGPDDREALKLATRIAKNNRVHVVIKRIRQSSEAKSPIIETTNEEEYINDGLTFQPSAIKSTSLQTYQRILSNLTEKKSNNNSDKGSIISSQERRNSTQAHKKKTVEIIDLNDTTNTFDNSNDNNNNNNNNNGSSSSNNNIALNDDLDNEEDKSGSDKNSVDSLSVFSKPSIAVSISSSEKSSKTNSREDLLNGNTNNTNDEINNNGNKVQMISPKNGISTPSNPSSPIIINDMTPISQNSRNTSISQNTPVSKSSSLMKKGTLLSKYIKNKKNTMEERFNIHQSKGSLRKSFDDGKEDGNGSTKSFSIEIEVDTYEDRAAFSELKKLLNKNNTHLSIEDVYLDVNDQLNDICVDLVHSIGKKDLLIIGRESILPEINNAIINNDTDNNNPKQSINDLKNKNDTGNEYNNSYDPTDNTESNIQKTVSSFVTSHFYGGNTNVGSALQEEARLRTMAGSLGYRIIKECSASVMIIQASKYKGYDKTMEDITEMEEEKIDVRRKFSISQRKSSLIKLNSFKEHVKMSSISSDSLELKKIYKRRSDSMRSNSRNENINAVTIKNSEDDSNYNKINISEIAKELNNKVIDEEEDEEKSSKKNRIEFDISDNERKGSNQSNSTRNENEINIMNSSSFSRNNTLSSRDELERERIKKIIKERDTYLNNEIHQDIADSDVLYIDSSGDELDNLDTGL